jgi:hexosaminidase
MMLMSIRFCVLLIIVVCGVESARSYLYFPSSDVMSTRETIFPQANSTDLATLSLICDATPGCIGFNQDGWLKNGSSSLAPYPVDLYMLAPDPAPAPPPLLWPLPRNLSLGSASLVVSSAFTFTAITPCAELSAAFTRFQDLIFSHGSANGTAVAARLGAPLLLMLRVDVADVTAPLDLGVDETYSLVIPDDGSAATLSSPTVWGALHGLQTLSQLITYDFDAGAYWTSSPVTISDGPNFPWRGIMIDSARQFIPLITIRGIVDSMTMVKLNTLHLHLLDCDSFPLEVMPPFQRLWEGAFSPRERYTRAELAALVEFSRLRGVRVVFEFDSPGHMGAMCKGYPSLCPTPACSKSYGGDVLDPSSADTLPAMQAVISTLSGLSIDSVIHLGGDEVQFTCWLNSPSVVAWMAANNVSTGLGIYEYFVQQSDKMALAANKSPMRWEEVWNNFKTALDPRTIVHAWLSSASLISASNAGYRTVYSVSSKHDTYLDYLQDQWHLYYALDILEDVTNATAVPYILGGQACMWGETVDAASIQSVIWPRAAAFAERVWTYNTSVTARDWATVTRFSQLRCSLLDRGVGAPLPGAINAGDMRPAWTVGSCGGGYRKLC